MVSLNLVPPMKVQQSSSSSSQVSNPAQIKRQRVDKNWWKLQGQQDKIAYLRNPEDVPNEDSEEEMSVTGI